MFFLPLVQVLSGPVSTWILDASGEVQMTRVKEESERVMKEGGVMAGSSAAGLSPERTGSRDWSRDSTPEFTAPSLTITTGWGRPKCSSIGECENQRCSIHTAGCHRW